MTAPLHAGDDGRRLGGRRAGASASSASVSTYAAASDPSRDIMPGLERKTQAGGPLASLRPSFVLRDGLAFMAYGAQAIAQDEFSKCFAPKPRNFLSSLIERGPLYLLDGAFRYFVLFPLRLAMMLAASMVFFACLPVMLHLKNDAWQRWLFRFYCNAFLASWGARIRYHGKKPRVGVPHIFVANHTSVIDYIILSANAFPHATVAQTHGGLIGFLEHSVLTLNGSLMFNRAEKADRSVLAKKMREHISNPELSPLLIFPEGTCVNNEYTVLFQKGAFELGVVVAPVAIKYNKNWADAYWHSKTQSFTYHLFYLMTRWALVADVWYLEPRSIRPGQTSPEFADEVKAEISAIAKLKNLSWDGYFKNYAPPVEKRAKLKQNPQGRYGAVIRSRIKNRVSPGHVRRSSDGYSENGSKADGEGITPSTFFDRTDAESSAQDASTTRHNNVLVALNDAARRHDMIEAIADKRNNLVATWKRFTKMRTDDTEFRRVENSSWRLWFRQKREFEERKHLEAEQDLQDEMTYNHEMHADARMNRPRHSSIDAASMFGIVTSYFPSTNVLFGTHGVDNGGLGSGEIRRARSYGSSMSAIGNLHIANNIINGNTDMTHDGVDEYGHNQKRSASADHETHASSSRVARFAFATVEDAHEWDK